MTRLLIVLGVVVAAWLLVVGWYYLSQERVIFQPSRLSQDHAFRFERDFEEVWIEVAPDTRLNALFFPASSAAATGDSSRAAPRGAVLYLHGNAGHLQDWGHHADLYVDAGHDFLVVDYRGYGKSAGSPESEAQFYADAAVAREWLRARSPDAPLTVVGYSLGSAAAARVACPDHAARLVLLAPFFSLRDLARRIVPFVPLSLLRYPMRNDLVLAECRIPVTIFHGLADSTIPIDQSRRLAEWIEASDGDVRHVALPGIGHADITASPTFRAEMGALLGAE